MSAIPLSSASLATDIIRSIENILVCSGPYGLWTIGLAENIRQARTVRDGSGLWADWETDDQETARRVLEYFTQQGMMLDAASDEEGLHVYIF